MHAAPQPTVPPGQADQQAVRGLQPALVAAAVGRVRLLAGAAAVLLPILYVVHAATQPEVAAITLDAVNRLALLAAILLAIGVLALQQFRLASASTILRLSVVMQVAVAFAVSLVEATWLGPEPILGVSAVGAWMLAFGAFVPMPSSWAIAGTLSAATAWPVAWTINAARAGLGPAGLRPYAAWVLVNYVLAGVAYVLSQRASVGSATAASEDVGGYRLLSKIGEGGMGEVWKASHRMLARLAAVKIIRPDVVETVSRAADTAAARFRREANLIARLQSPHTVFVYDFGLSEDGRFYYAMELLDGVSLQALVTTFGPLPAARAVAVLTQMCVSLHEAHEHGLVHRDLKPSNVMLCKVALTYDFVKVLDFGLAKRVDDQSATQLTIAGTTAGTPGYMAPEATIGEQPVDRRADVYALGCIAYFLLTGQLVFDEPNPTRMALRHLRDAPEPPSSRTDRPIPPALERLVMECLAKDPAQRPATAAVLADGLAACGAGAWSDADARQWWAEHLPSDSPWRPFALASPVAPRP